MKVAIGGKGVPIGDYTREVLDRLGPQGAAILRNVRSEEPDVKSIVGKLTQGGAAPASCTSPTSKPRRGRCARWSSPAAQPRVVYAAAVVKGTKHPEEARRFVAGLLSGEGQRALLAAGFEPPPT